MRQLPQLAAPRLPQKRSVPQGRAIKAKAVQIATPLAYELGIRVQPTATQAKRNRRQSPLMDFVETFEGALVDRVGKTLPQKQG